MKELERVAARLTDVRLLRRGRAFIREGSVRKMNADGSGARRHRLFLFDDVLMYAAGGGVVGATVWKPTSVIKSALKAARGEARTYKVSSITQVNTILCLCYQTLTHSLILFSLCSLPLTGASNGFVSLLSGV
jgi:hypothetical protein